jgi:hypothetical protein
MHKVIEETISPVRGKLEALRDDIKEICTMIASLQGSPTTETSF